MLKSTWLLHWLNHDHQLTAVAAYRLELYAGTGVFAYFLMLISFPVIGLFISTAAAAFSHPVLREPDGRARAG